MKKGSRMADVLVANEKSGQFCYTQGNIKYHQSGSPVAPIRIRIKDYRTVPPCYTEKAG